jgi:hypothetical protein
LPECVGMTRVPSPVTARTRCGLTSIEHYRRHSKS